jgi:hypothetical protein
MGLWGLTGDESKRYCQVRDQMLDDLGGKFETEVAKWENTIAETVLLDVTRRIVKRSLRIGIKDASEELGIVVRAWNDGYQRGYIDHLSEAAFGKHDDIERDVT